MDAFIAMRARDADREVRILASPDAVTAASRHRTMLDRPRHSPIQLLGYPFEFSEVNHPDPSGKLTRSLKPTQPLDFPQIDRGRSNWFLIDDLARR
jgi:hypothetical protein